MPVLSSKTQYRSGVPLGGIGAGKLEVLPSGVFNAFTFLNNWGEPVSGNDAYPGVLGQHLGVFVESRGARGFSREARLLQTVPVAGAPGVKEIRYHGYFPCARLEYLQSSLGVRVELEAWSPWVPGDSKDTALPAAYFRLTAKNPGPAPRKVSFLFMGRNLSGDWCVGRENRLEEDAREVRLSFTNPKSARHDMRRGQALWSFQKKGWKTSYLESWNAVTKNFRFTPEDASLAPWPVFAATGALPDLSPKAPPAIGENRELCGAVAASTELKPGEAKSWDFSLAWDYPAAPGGRYQSRWFSGAPAAARYAASRRKPLEKKTRRFQELVFSLPFPAWFNDALLTNLAPFFAATRRWEDGRFAFYEAPVVCPLMGTVDVGFYGSIPLAWFFPELEHSQLLQFARSQSDDGYVPHDLGKHRVDCPSAGTTFYRWKDLNPKFVLMAWRDYLWSGDRAFLSKIYPYAKKAVRWSLAQDQDGNGLPDHEGADQTFDLWDMRGTHPYTSSLMLAALLAARKMAVAAGDRTFEKECAAAFERGQSSFVRELWNGRYFGRDYCALSQLNGQWYADLLGLGDIVAAAKVRSAVRAVYATNRRHSRYGLVNSVRPDGRQDTSNPHAQNVWAGMNYAFFSLGLMRGLPLTKVLKEVYRIWNNTVNLQKNPWNQPDMVDSKTGRYLFGDAYYRNMAVWSIPMAHAKTNKKTAEILIRLKNLR